MKVIYKRTNRNVDRKREKVGLGKRKEKRKNTEVRAWQYFQLFVIK